MMTRTRVLLSPARLTSLLIATNLLTLPSRTLLSLLLLFLTVGQPATSIRDTRFFFMTRPVCSGVYRNLPAAVLEGGGSLGKVPAVCDVTFASSDENSVWMLRFERAVIRDCSVVITILDSSMHPATRPPVLTQGCIDRDPGTLYINSTSVTIRLQHKNASDYTFRIAITTFSTDPFESECSRFQCNNGLCIPKSLVCDDVDNCFDGSDEAHNGTSRCYESIWPLQGENWGVLASVLGVGLVLGVMAACCRHIKRKRNSTIDDLYDLNEGPYVHKYAYRYAIIRPPKKPNKTKVVLGRDGHMHYKNTSTSVV